MEQPLLGNIRTQHTAMLMIQNKKLPHALIIEGPPGSGKKTFAEFLAMAALCSNENPPCGECKSCRTLKAGSNRDYTFFTPEKDLITVDDVRNLRTQAYYSPIAAPYRVFVVDRADCMNEQAQNTLLKIIEEPPETAKFIFLCQSAASLLATIRSRCICFTLGSVEPSAEVCQFIAKKSCCGLEQAKSALIAANGIIGVALVNLAQAADANTEPPLTAAELLSLAAKGNSSYKILCKIQPLQKNREQVKNLICDLKTAVIEQIKLKALNKNCPLSSKKLTALLSGLENLEAALPLNPSTALIICHICDLLTS